MSEHRRGSYRREREVVPLAIRLPISHAGFCSETPPIPPGPVLPLRSGWSRQPKEWISLACFIGPGRRWSSCECLTRKGTSPNLDGVFLRAGRLSERCDGLVTGTFGPHNKPKRNARSNQWGTPNSHSTVQSSVPDCPIATAVSGCKKLLYLGGSGLVQSCRFLKT